MPFNKVEDFFKSDWEDILSSAIYLFSYQVFDFPYVYESGDSWTLRGAHTPYAYVLKIKPTYTARVLSLEIRCFSDVVLSEDQEIFSYEFFARSEVIFKEPTRLAILTELYKVYKEVREMN